MLQPSPNNVATVPQLHGVLIKHTTSCSQTKQFCNWFHWLLFDSSKHCGGRF